MSHIGPSGSDLPRALDFLRLLHTDSPGGIFDRFCRLVEDQPHLRIKNWPDHPSAEGFEDFLEWDSEVSDSWLDFLRWWFNQYQRDVARKYDALTGLIKRSHWNRRLRSHLRDRDETYSVVLADIDHFKRFNDRYGHAVGDRVLRGVGELFRSVFNSCGWCIRYGGEELLSIVTENPQENLDRTESFRKRVRNTNYFEDQPERVTVSLGVSPPKGDEKPPEERIEEADLALYESKNEGRDRVTKFNSYLQRREKLSIWGFYRYLWTAGLRFEFGQDGKTFYFYDDRILQRYSWSRDRTSPVQLPESLQSIQKLQFVDGSLYLLDGTGEVWRYYEERWFRLTDPDQPRIVSFVKGGKVLQAAGINNQLYQFEDNRWSRLRSLPSDWDRLLYLDGLLCVSGGTLKQILDSTEWSLPGSPRDFTAGMGELVMSSEGGKLYAFDREVNRWKQMTLPKFLSRRIRARNVERREEYFLIFDNQGRFFYASQKHKSVPQKMNLEL